MHLLKLKPRFFMTSPKIKTIIVIDQESSRRNKINVMLQNVALNNNVYILTNANINSSPQDINLVAVIAHIGDRKELETLINNPNHSPKTFESLVSKAYTPEQTKTFWFSSVGLSGSDNSKDGDISILKKISLDCFDLIQSDADEIIKYSLGSRKELPRCCATSILQETLLTIYILCQGYLLAHLKHFSLKDIDIENAISLLSYSSDNLEISDQQLSTASLLTQELAWWRECLDNSQENTQDKLELKIIKDWNDYKKEGSDIRKLLRVIYQSNNGTGKSPTSITLKLVSKAYCSIHKYIASKNSL